MKPVPGALDADARGMAEGPVAAVVGGIAGAALLPVQEKRRTGDALPEGLDVPAAHVVRKPRAHVVVKLQAICPVLVLVHAVAVEVPYLLGRQVRVLLMHAPEFSLDGAVATCQPHCHASL